MACRVTCSFFATSVTLSQTSMLRSRSTKLPGRPLGLPVSANVLSALCLTHSISIGKCNWVRRDRQVSIVTCRLASCCFGAIEGKIAGGLAH